VQSSRQVTTVKEKAENRIRAEKVSVCYKVNYNDPLQRYVLLSFSTSHFSSSSNFQTVTFSSTKGRQMKRIFIIFKFRINANRFFKQKSGPPIHRTTVLTCLRSVALSTKVRGGGGGGQLGRLAGFGAPPPPRGGFFFRFFPPRWGV